MFIFFDDEVLFKEFNHDYFTKIDTEQFLSAFNWSKESNNNLGLHDTIIQNIKINLLKTSLKNLKGHFVAINFPVNYFINSLLHNQEDGSNFIQFIKQQNKIMFVGSNDTLDNIYKKINEEID